MAEDGVSQTAPRRAPLLAMGIAISALALAVVTVVVVAGRDGRPVPEIETHRVLASDVVELSPSSTSAVGGRTGGVRVIDAELASALSLSPEDVITAISGRAIVLEHDLRVIIFNASLLDATTLYVELERGGVPALVRWQVDGSLYEARIATEAIFPRVSPR